MTIAAMQPLAVGRGGLRGVVTAPRRAYPTADQRSALVGIERRGADGERSRRHAAHDRVGRGRQHLRLSRLGPQGRRRDGRRPAAHDACSSLTSCISRARLRVGGSFVRRLPSQFLIYCS